MAGKELFNKASEVCADEGQVLVDGPDGVDVALTPEAAVETGERLIEHGVTAAGQRYFRKSDKGERKSSD